MIVESPAKAHTIQKYLGPDYEVMASMGHVRDLPASRLSVDVKNDFAPNYENIKGKGELIKKLRAEAKKSDYVYLATDPDREGEAISWHLAQLLKLDETEPNRVTFNEITKSGIKYGMEHPRCIDQQLVDAQQARRVLDTILAGNTFTFENAANMRRAAVCCFLISAAALGRTVWGLCFYRSLMPLLTYNALFVPIFLMAGLLCMVMSALFRQAAELKAENDLTI